ncbi:MAG: hypothetical protein HRU70_13530 [Phycisphaeraceae bacterium]|nr:MAG: hypothetical protein HRU70_13530 [Phycisphaeraceae bacterium]
MHVTSKLLRVFQVEKQIRGLKSRLVAAERFLAEQDRQIAALDTRRASVDNQIKQALVAVRESEGEAARLDARMAQVKAQMDSATTNKEYKASLTEFNTLKAEKDRHETAALEQMGKVDELKKQVAETQGLIAERGKMRDVAKADRDTRENEIKGRLEELAAERAAAAADVPQDALKTLESLLKTKGEEAMAPIEEQDRKRYEFTCGSCMINLTMEAINGLLSTGRLTRCTSCGSILYCEPELAEKMTSSKR